MKGARFIDIAGIRTRYFETGAGEPLVLVHGSGFAEASGSAEDWETVFERFGRHFRVYAYDKIGQGFTDNPKRDEDYVIGATVWHLWEFIKAVGAPNAHVMGHSRGAYTVCRLAMEHPEVVRSLIILDSGTLMKSSSEKFYDSLLKKLEAISDVRESYRALKEANSFRPDHLTKELLDAYVEISRLPKTQEAAAKMGGGVLPGSGLQENKDPNHLGARFLRDLAERRQETHEWIKTRGIKVPTLVVWGYNDPSATLEQAGFGVMRLIFENAPQAQMHIFNQSGHYCYREHPEAFVSLVTSFIQSSRG